jgi:hypothetical protein
MRSTVAFAGAGAAVAARRSVKPHPVVLSNLGSLRIETIAEPLPRLSVEILEAFPAPRGSFLIRVER